MNFETIPEKLAYSLGSMAMGQKIMTEIEKLREEWDHIEQAVQVLDALTERLREI